ncbi:MAG: nicotinate (nicotinamide) nucleotide adenylyltransferase [Luteolibacter sp.]
MAPLSVGVIYGDWGSFIRAIVLHSDISLPTGMVKVRKIALFGGTFDPVHRGHIHLASLAKKSLELDEVRFLPCHVSPHKTDRHPASGEDRCEMLRLATAELPWAFVDDFELKRAEPSFSFQTAEAMTERFKGCRLFWIMGGDQWEALPKWKHPERLAQCVEFIVLSRGEKILQPREGYTLHVVHGEHPASASEIRTAISQGASEHPCLVPDVARWIEKKGLYRG